MVLVSPLQDVIRVSMPTAIFLAQLDSITLSLLNSILWYLSDQLSSQLFITNVFFFLNLHFFWRRFSIAWRKWQINKNSSHTKKAGTEREWFYYEEVKNLNETNKFLKRALNFVDLIFKFHFNIFWYKI